MKLWHTNSGPLTATTIIRHQGLSVLVDPCLSLPHLLCCTPRPVACSADDALRYVSYQGKPSANQKNGCPGETCFYDNSKPCPNIDFGQIDVVLLSHWQSVLALPLISEYGRFQGQILATEPTSVLGGLSLEEMAMLLEGTAQPVTSTTDSRPQQGSFTVLNARSSLARIRPISFNETVTVYGKLNITAMSSGIAIGSCNWVIESSKAKILYLSPFSPHTTGHPKLLDETPFHTCDTFVMGGLAHASSWGPEEALESICKAVGATVCNQGSVLFPVYPTGNIYDFLEVLHNYLSGIGREGVPFYFVSTQARASLVLANIFSEWLTNSKAEKSCMAEPPFTFQDMQTTQRLRVLSSVHDLALAHPLKEPCIVFASHPSLRLGDAVHLLNHWKSSPNCLLLLTDPEYSLSAAIAPFQPMAMKAVHFPLDYRATVTEASNLLQRIKPRVVAVPSQFLRSRGAEEGGGLACQPGTEIIELKERAIIHIQTPESFEKCIVQEQLAKKLRAFVPGEKGLAVAVRAELETTNNKLTLVEKDPAEDTTDQPDWQPRQRLVGTPSLDALVEELQSRLYGEVYIRSSSAAPNQITLEAPLSHVTVSLSPGQVHVEAEDGNVLHDIEDIIGRHVQAL